MAQLQKSGAANSGGKMVNAIIILFSIFSSPVTVGLVYASRVPEQAVRGGELTLSTCSGLMVARVSIAGTGWIFSRSERMTSSSTCIIMTSDQHCHVDVIIVMSILLLCCHLHLDTLGLGFAAVGEVAAAEGVRVGGLGLVLAGVEQPLQLGLVPARHVVAVETLDTICHSYQFTVFSQLTSDPSENM